MPNKERETDLQKMMSDIKGRHSKRMNALLVTMDDEDFPIAYFKMLEYASPKLQRQEITGAIEVNKVTIEHVVIPIEQIEE